MYTQTQQLPVSHTQIDGSTFNNNLPAGNDVWPTLQMPPRLDPNLASMVVAMFRTYAQTRGTKSPLHCFAYNLLSMNRFNNQLFQEWCQRAVDFAEFLAVVQGANNTFETIVEKASSKIYLGFLCVIVQQYPAVAATVAPEMMQGLNLAGQEFTAIQQDVQAFKQRGGALPMGGYTSGGVQVSGISSGARPPITSMLSGVTPASGVNVANTLSNLPPLPTPAPTITTVSGRGSALYLEQNPGQSVPQSWDAAGGMGATNTTIQPITPPPAVEEVTAPPISLDEVILDPTAYMPPGFIIEEDRRYDEIHAPGGVLVKPAHQTKWKRTPGDDQPYSVLYNPDKYIMFYVRWPDGVVKEKLAEITADMDYLKHEIDDELRRRAMKPDGVVVASTHNIIDNDQPIQPLQQVVEALQEDQDPAAATTPVLLDAVFTCSTDIENEQEARNTVIQALQLDTKDPVPAHEYVTVKFHPLEISEECYLALNGFKDYKTFEVAARKLKLLLESGMLPLRYYRLINERLTRAVNLFLSDSLSITSIRIEDFVSDIEELPNYLGVKRGKEVQTVFESAAPTLFSRWVCMATEDAEGTKPVYGLVDETVNYQLSWTEADLVSLNIEKEPVLVSQASHPKVVKVIRDMLARAVANETVSRRHLRLITADGVYMEVIRGRLIKDAILLKRV